MSDPLLDHARRAAQRAYAPYSGFSVGCAVESVEGEVAVGANMENACYRLGVCAEAAALAAAQTAFGLDKVRRIAVAGGRYREGALSGSALVTPCGACRQAIFEAAQLGGRDIEVVCGDADGAVQETYPISQLLPLAFGPKSMS